MMDNIGKRVLAIDFGTKRVGIAISDPLCLFPSITLVIQNDKNLLSEIIKIITEKNVDRIILGYPENDNGKKTDLTELILKFKSEIEKKSRIEVQLWNEHLTSIIAQSRIIDSVKKKSKRRDKSLIDAHSAGIILEEYLKSIEVNKS